MRSLWRLLCIPGSLRSLRKLPELWEADDASAAIGLHPIELADIEYYINGVPAASGCN